VVYASAANTVDKNMEKVANSGFDGSFTAFTNAANYARAGKKKFNRI
jgi:hypothetical protein